MFEQSAGHLGGFPDVAGHPGALRQAVDHHGGKNLLHVVRHHMGPAFQKCHCLRRALQAVAEKRETGDLSTMEDPAALQQVVEAMIRG